MQVGKKYLLWFNGLSNQEQVMLSLGAAAVVFYMLFVLLWQPLIKAEESLLRRNKLAGESLQEVSALATQYKRLLNESAGSSGSNQSGAKSNMTSLIDKLVKNNQLAMKRFQPSSSGDIQIRFENSPFNNILALLDQLETQNNVVIKDLSISPGSSAAAVNVSVRLMSGS